MSGRLTYALDEGSDSRIGIDCPLVGGHAARVDRHGDRVSVRCLSGCDDGDVKRAFAPLRDAVLAEMKARTNQGRSSTEGGFAPPTSIGTAWPVLDEQALHGLPGEIVGKIAENSESDPALLLVTLLAMFGSAVGRGPGFRVEGDFHSTALFVVGVGESSKARKGSSLGQVRDLLAAADPEWAKECMASGLSTGEGLIHAVRDPRSERRPAKTKAEKEAADESGYIDEEVDPGVADKRLFAVMGEFAQALKVMGREGNTLSPVIRDLWDHGRARTLTKGQPEAATDAHVSILGHIVRDELVRRLDETEVANGFANRFLFVCAERKKLLPFGGRMDDGDRLRLAGRLREAMGAARNVSALDLDPDAREAWATVYPELSEGDDGMLGAVTGRAEAQVRRLAVIYALLDRSPIVQLSHLRAALALWDYCRGSAAHVFAGSTGSRLSDRLAAILADAGGDGLTRTELRERIGHRIEGKDIDIALGVLKARGLAHQETIPTGGRPANRWQAGRGDMGVRVEERPPTDLSSTDPSFAPPPPNGERGHLALIADNTRSTGSGHYADTIVENDR